MTPTRFIIMPIYTVNSTNTTPAQNGILVTSQAANLSGPKLVFHNRQDWVHVPKAGRSAQAGPNDPGIYTSGQSFCLAIIVARFAAVGGWSATLAHVSGEKHSLVTQLVNGADNTCYVAIGARASSLARMNFVQTAFALKNPLGIWIYVALNDSSPDFGMNSQGYFGETV